MARTETNHIRIASTAGKAPESARSSDRRTPRRSQNPYAERFIASIRTECLNYYIILNARRLKRTLSSYFRCHHESTTYLSLGKQCPFPREVLNVGKIVAIPQLGGLHHRYERVVLQLSSVERITLLRDSHFYFLNGQTRIHLQ
jgi:hypothetical protein